MPRGSAVAPRSQHRAPNTRCRAAAPQRSDEAGQPLSSAHSSRASSSETGVHAAGNAGDLPPVSAAAHLTIDPAAAAAGPAGSPSASTSTPSNTPSSSLSSSLSSSSGSSIDDGDKTLRQQERKRRDSALHALVASSTGRSSSQQSALIAEEDRPEALTDVDESSGTRIVRRDGGVGSRPGSPVAPGADPGEAPSLDEADNGPAGLLSRMLAGNDDAIMLAYSVFIGIVVASSVFAFDCTIQYIHDLPDIASQARAGILHSSYHLAELE